MLFDFSFFIHGSLNTYGLPGATSLCENRAPAQTPSLGSVAFGRNVLVFWSLVDLTGSLKGSSGDWEQDESPA